MSASQQKGISLVEVLAATALLGLTIYSGWTLLELPARMRQSVQQNHHDAEKHRQAFEAFYRAWNAPGNASLIETQTGDAVQIRFSGNADVLSQGSGFVTVSGGNPQLDNLLSYRVIPAPPEDSSLCKLTTLADAAANRWNYTCPQAGYNGIARAFANAPSGALPMAMIDGRLCYITAHMDNTVTLDASRNSCPSLAPTNTSGDHRGMFTLPRLWVFSTDGRFSEAIFESFMSPRERWGGSGLNYPTQY